MKQNRIFFDIETQANPENLALAPEPKAPGNLKDPAKIAAAIEEKRRDLIESAALDPDYGKVLSIGISYQGEDEVEVFVVGMKFPVGFHPETNEPMAWDVMTEADLLALFWDRFTLVRGACVGYNIIGFDLPFLMARSMYLGVKIPYIPNLARFRVEPITDLYAIRYNWAPGKGLKTVCKLLGIQNECDGVDGSQVKDMTPAQLSAYQVSDVKLTKALFDRMNGVYFNL